MILRSIRLMVLLGTTGCMRQQRLHPEAQAHASRAGIRRWPPLPLLLLRRPELLEKVEEEVLLDVVFLVHIAMAPC